MISGIMFAIGIGVSVLSEALAWETNILYELEITPAMTAMLSFIPVFMYGAWLGAQVKVEF